jgi:Kef-type K+ transport system membrane component KefB
MMSLYVGILLMFTKWLLWWAFIVHGLGIQPKSWAVMLVTIFSIAILTRAGQELHEIAQEELE